MKFIIGTIFCFLIAGMLFVWVKSHRKVGELVLPVPGLGFLGFNTGWGSVWVETRLGSGAPALPLSISEHSYESVIAASKDEVLPEITTSRSLFGRWHFDTINYSTSKGLECQFPFWFIIVVLVGTGLYLIVPRSRQAPGSGADAV